MTIGIIGGGNMAEAIIAGILFQSPAPYKIVVSEPSPDRRNFLKSKFDEIHVVSNNAEVFNAGADKIILAVKPQTFPELLKEIHPFTVNRILISIAAGITMKTIQKACPQAKIVRIMPNTPFLAMAGCGGISFASDITNKEKTEVIGIFKNSGLLLELPEEKMHAVTAISGSGPAYFFYFTEELIKSGIKAGLSHEESRILATHTLFGAGKLLKESTDNAETLRKKVTSPKGTTEAAINSYIAQQTGTIIETAVNAAIKRSEELAEEK